MFRTWQTAVLAFGIVVMVTPFHVQGVEQPEPGGMSYGRGIFDKENFGLEVVWKKVLGPGNSRITVEAGRAATMFSDGQFDNLIALDMHTGKEIWRYRIAATYRGHDGSEDGPHASPIVSEGVVYSLGPAGHLFAVSIDDGREIWATKIDEEFGASLPFWGFASSPVVDEDVLIVQTGGSNGHSILGLNKKTGELLWSVGDDRVGYQSPALLTLAYHRQVITVSNKNLMGIHPRTGKVLWRHQHSTTELDGSSQPGLVSDNTFLLTPSATEYRSDAILYKVKSSSDGFGLAEVWRSNAFRGNYAVPVRYGEYLYGFNRRFLTCVDAATGEAVWKSRQPGGHGLILVDGHLVIWAEEGFVVVAKATPEGYREKARLRTLDRGSSSAPTFAADRILVRNHTQIACIRVTESGDVSEFTSGKSRYDFMKSEFGAFVDKVEAADDKKAIIDEFMNSHEQFPIVEGDSLVHFVYRGQVEDIAVVGSMTDFDSPEAMERIMGTDFYYKSFSVESNARWEYLFNIGFDKFVPDPLNPRFAPDEWGGNVSEVVMPGWAHPRHLDEPTGERGRIESFNFESKVRDNEREVKVFLPLGYDEGEERYPLLIVNKGLQVLERGKMNNSLDNLIGKSVSPVIVAFIGLPKGRTSWQQAGGPDSVQEYGGPLTENHARMLAKELVPYLEEKYRTIPRPDARAIMGNRSAALAALYTAVNYPDVFGKVALQSLRLGPTPRQSSRLLHRPVGGAVFKLLRERERLPIQFYLDWAHYELRSSEQGIDVQKDNREFAELLKEKGYTFVGGETADGAGWGSWRARTDRILEAFFPLGAKK